MLINFIKQTKPTNCGQTVIAMLFNIDIEMAEKLIGHDGVTTEPEIIGILKKHNLVYEIKPQQLPNPNRGAIWLELRKNPKNSRQKHWTLLVNGAILDPAGRKIEELWPVEKFWMLKWD